MTENFKAAGLSILRYAYEACKEHGVPREEIAVLFLTLSFTVVEGQGRGDSEPAPERKVDLRVLPIERIRAIHKLTGIGMSAANIADVLGLAYETVKRHQANPLPGNLHVAEPPLTVLPHSNGATARRADDQEPPKV